MLSQDLIQETPGLCSPLCVQPTLKLAIAFHLNVQVLVVLSSVALESDIFSLKGKEQVRGTSLGELGAERHQ